MYNGAINSKKHTMINVWVQIASNELPHGPAHTLMARVNELHAINEPNDPKKPFPVVDIGFAELLDHVKCSHNQREMDLVYVTNLYQRTWVTLHVSLAVLREKCCVADEEQIREMYAALKRLGLPHLLDTNLPPKWSKWLKKGTIKT